MGRHAVQITDTSLVHSKPYRYCFSEKQHTGIRMVNIDLNACKCAIMESKIFNSKCTKPFVGWAPPGKAREITALCVSPSLSFSDCLAGSRARTAGQGNDTKGIEERGRKVT